MRERILDFLRNCFIARVWLRDRGMALFFAGFAAIQLLAQLVTAEVTPFFLYGMYSDVLHPEPQYVRVACSVDGEPVVQEDLPRFAGELFFSTLYRYEELDANDGEDLFRPFLEKRFGRLPASYRTELNDRLSFNPDSIPAFETWVHRYLERVSGHPISSLRIDRELYRYVDERPILLERNNLIKRQR